MPKKEPSAPDAQSEKDVIVLFQQLYDASHNLLADCHASQFERIPGHLNVRANLITAIQGHDLTQLQGERRQQVESLLETIRSLEPMIDQALVQLREDVDRQLHSMMDSKKTLGSYRLERDDDDETMRRDA